ncbi:DUF6449 domain-containing protein [Natranaerobius thermophilus]|uniref:DUF6449 domain-containing protein n=1 Tax=Natranaerobius thermophilus (strain ATCC BAA-1301 / DSM 18059 / JW/NM-WN-LF) TaxID=457570 RepID=B2A7C6_NATTJ|nr:DUF6449 domain-containing protein [Natranaerobius thermophilus]ACB84320.1 conserved hypothetical protein [Natranaerobius thermophilus JW/NM-WN-LF]
MKSILPLFNKGLVFSNLKRFWWVSALYSLLLFFIVPFQMIIQLDEVTQSSFMQDRLLNLLDLTTNPGQTQFLLVFVLPVVVAILVFRYLQLGSAASMFHSLPVTRKQLYLNNLISGLIILVIPVLFNGFLLTLFHATTELSWVYNMGHVFNWGGYTLLFILIMYSFAVFVGMFTGNSVAQLVFNYILHILPLGLFYLIQTNLPHLIHGYSRNIITEPAFLEKLPLMVIGNAEITEVIIWYLVFSAIFFISAYYAYKLRHIEVAGDLISFSVIQPIFKYGVTFCTMLLGGAYSASISHGSLGAIVFGYLISSLVGYFIAEMLIQKTYKVFNAYKGYLIYLGIIILLFVGIQADVTGYQSRVPDSEEVESVFFGRGAYQFRQIQEGHIEPSKVSGFYQEHENIENVIKLHEKLIKTDKNTQGSHYSLIYTLKDGSVIARDYTINQEHYTSLLKPIYESLEYKEAEYPILQQDASKIDSITLGDDRNPENQITLTDEQEIQTFSEIISSEIMELEYEELHQQNRNYLFASIEDEEGTTYYQLKESYEELRNWLVEEGYYEDFALSHEDIRYIEIGEDDFSHGVRAGESEEQTIEIRDPELIKEVFQLSSAAPRGNRSDSDYFWATFHFQDNMGRQQFVDQLALSDTMWEDLSSELHNKLEQVLQESD